MWSINSVGVYGTHLGRQWWIGPLGINNLEILQCASVQQKIAQSRVQTMSTQALQEVVQYVWTLSTSTAHGSGVTHSEHGKWILNKNQETVYVCVCVCDSDIPVTETQTDTEMILRTRISLVCDCMFVLIRPFISHENTKYTCVLVVPMFLYLFAFCSVLLIYHLICLLCCCPMSMGLEPEKSFFWVEFAFELLFLDWYIEQECLNSTDPPPQDFW